MTHGCAPCPMAPVRSRLPGSPAAAGRRASASRELHRHVEISDAERTVAAAQVTSQGPGGTARASLRAESGHITPGRRASLVDAVLDLPEVQESARLQVAFPLGDCETLQRFQERCPGVRTHPAGASAITEANLPARRPAAHRADHRGNGPPRTSLDAEANGRKTKPDQALSGSAGHFAAQCPPVLSGDNEYAAPDASVIAVGDIRVTGPRHVPDGEVLRGRRRPPASCAAPAMWILSSGQRPSSARAFPGPVIRCWSRCPAGTGSRTWPRYRSRCQGHQDCSLNSPPGSNSCAAVPVRPPSPRRVCTIAATRGCAWGQ